MEYSNLHIARSLLWSAGIHYAILVRVLMEQIVYS